MTTAPRISIVMSCFKRRTIPAEAIESILSQTFEDFEFIILDDGSNDATRDIISDMKTPGSAGDRSGSSGKPRLAARLNQGMALARADIIARMDGDDIAMPDRLATRSPGWTGTRTAHWSRHRWTSSMPRADG